MTSLNKVLSACDDFLLIQFPHKRTFHSESLMCDFHRFQMTAFQKERDTNCLHSFMFIQGF